MPPMAAKITIVSEAATGAQGQRLEDVYFYHSSQLVLINAFLVAKFCIISLGCVIHPRVFVRLGVAPFPAPPTTNLFWTTGQPVKIQGACFLRVTYPEHPEERKQDQQLFYVLEEWMAVGVTLSKSCCKNLGIIPPHCPRIAKADVEEEGKRLEEMK